MGDRLALIQELIADDAAMDRMAYRLLAEVSLETGVIHLGTPDSARELLCEVLAASLAPEERPQSPARPA